MPACGRTRCAESVVVSYRRDTSGGEKEVVYGGRTAVLSWQSVCAGWSGDVWDIEKQKKIKID